MREEANVPMMKRESNACRKESTPGTHATMTTIGTHSSRFERFETWKEKYMYTRTQFKKKKN
jgi:hypothetical protein